MMYAFWAFLFIFLDFDIPLAYGGILNASPALLGYAILFLANRKYRHENKHFHRLRWLSPIAFLLGVTEFTLDLLVLPLPKVAELVISVVMTVTALYIAYEFTEGVKELERSLYKKLDADKLSAAWIILSMTSLLEFLAIYIPNVMLPCALVHLLAIVWFESTTVKAARKLTGKA